MEKGKKNRNEYPKLSRDDQRWKQQDEFDSAGAQRELEDNESNASIDESGKDKSTDGKETNPEKSSNQSNQNL